MEKEFEILNHTADAGIIAYGSNMNEAFANAAKGMFSLITELEDVEETEYRDTELTAPDRESLLVEWLNELMMWRIFSSKNLTLRSSVTRSLKPKATGQKWTAQGIN